MITVYFETDSHAERVATFTYEEDYTALRPILEIMAKERGYTRVTESES